MKVCDSLALSLQRERGYGIISLEMSRNIFFIEKNMFEDILEKGRAS